RKEIAAPAFGPVPAGRGDARGEVQARPWNHARRDQPAHRLEGFRVSAEINYGSDAAVKISLQVLRPVAFDPAAARVRQVRVQIKEARDQRLTSGVDDCRARRDFDVPSDGRDAVAADQ